MFFKKKKKGIQVQDKVWISKVEKFRGLYHHLDQALQAGEPLLIINQFENTQQEVQQMMTKLDVSHQLIEQSTDEPQTVNLWMVSTENLLSIGVGSNWANHLQAKEGLQVIISEHHPSYQQEQVLLGHLTTLLPMASTTVFTALDEPFMQLFGGDRIITLMERIGVKENEALEHAMINKSIDRAQQKIDKKIAQNIQANSQQEWMERSGLLK